MFLTSREKGMMDSTRSSYSAKGITMLRVIGWPGDYHVRRSLGSTRVEISVVARRSGELWDMRVNPKKADELICESTLPLDAPERTTRIDPASGVAWPSMTITIPDPGPNRSVAAIRVHVS